MPYKIMNWIKKHIQYDKHADILRIFLTNKYEETIVSYFGKGELAWLRRSKDRKIVGVHIENFNYILRKKIKCLK